MLSSRIRHRPDTVGHSHPRKDCYAYASTKIHCYALVAIIWLHQYFMLADWFGLTQESDNHRDSGNLIVAKWRGFRGQGIRARGRRGQAEAINVSEALGVVTA